MSRWAGHHQIPLRPRGGGSYDSSLRSVDQAAGLPDLNRQGTGQPVCLAVTEAVHGLPGRVRHRAAQLDRAGLPQPHLLRPCRTRRPLRRLGTTATVLRRTTRRIPPAAL